MKNFDEVRTMAEAIEYVRGHVNDFSYVFDGFERVPAKWVEKDPLHRQYRDPRYNYKTRYFVTRLGGEINAETELLKALDCVEVFKLSPGVGTFREDAFELKAPVPGYSDRLYIKVFKNTDPHDNSECPVIVFHDGDDN